MKDLYRRFNININLKDSEKRFINKINNILLHGLGFNSKVFKSEDLSWPLCNTLGLEYESWSNLEAYLIEINFSEYLLRIQCLLNIIWEEKDYLDQYNLLLSTISEAIVDSPFDLGLRLKNSKINAAQIVLSGAPLLDKKLVDDVLGILDDKDKSAIKLAFEKGLKEFSESLKDRNKTKNVARDMQLACDEAVKFLFSDKNLGFKHIFKDQRSEKIGLNNYQVSIFHNLNEYIDKMAKHKADSQITIEDAEAIIYLTGIFIRLILLKRLKKN